MRTAEEILKEMWGENVHYNDWFKPVVKIINEARKEAIEECAKRSQVETSYLEKSQINVWRHKVDKESILSLINELK